MKHVLSLLLLLPCLVHCHASVAMLGPLLLLPCLVHCQLEFFFGRGASSDGAQGSNKALELSDSDFDEKVLGDGVLPHFIEFYTPWCHHCKRLAPTWDALAEELEGKVGIAKVDCTQHMMLRNRYSVQGFPTLLLFIRGTHKEFRGNRDKTQLVSWLTQQHAIVDEDDGGEKIKLHSWNYRGQSDSVRLALLEADQPFADRFYNSTEELDKRRAALGVVFPPGARDDLPILKVEFEAFASVHAALLYLAREHNLYGKGETQMATVDMVMAHVAQANRRYDRVVYGDSGPSIALPKSDSCVSWRQTENCDFKGDRQPESDRPCNEEVQHGWSGFCECKDGRRAAEVGCRHAVFTCQDECTTKEEKNNLEEFLVDAKRKNWDSNRVAYVKEAHGDLKALEGILQRNKKKFKSQFLVGEKLTVADLYAFDLVTKELGLNGEALDDLVPLKEWFVEVGVRDAIMSHLTSEARPKHPNSDDAFVGNEKNPENVAANPFLE